MPRVLLLIVAVLLAGCAADPPSTEVKDGTFNGAPQSLGSGSITTFVSLDDQDRPTEVGVRMTRDALEALPGAPVTLMLQFPAQAKATAIDHVMFNWNPQGHEPPELFGKPHFDYHFNMTDMATIAGINPEDPGYEGKAVLPPTQYVPAGYVLPPGPAPALQAVPSMGLHLVDGTNESLVPGRYNFEEILINGAWDGKYTFIEPMITRDWLLTNPNREQQLKQPESWQRTTYYPTTYRVQTDPTNGDYVISLGGMTMRTAS